MASLSGLRRYASGILFCLVDERSCGRNLFRDLCMLGPTKHKSCPLGVHSLEGQMQCRAKIARPNQDVHIPLGT